jgi:hypothetical protein
VNTPHQYAFYWQNPRDDGGSAHGTMVPYFDGFAVGGGHTIQCTEFDVGAYFDIFGGGDNNNGPLVIDWVRAYQLAPN